MAQPGGVLTRAGHTEAAVDLARMAGLEPAGVICEILNEDGSMARRPELEAFGRDHELKLGTIADLIRYRLENEATVARVAECDFPTSFGEFRMAAYQDRIDGRTHLALYHGSIRRDQPALVRVHVDNGVFDRYAEFRPGYAWPVDASLERIAAAGAGVIVLLDYRESGEQLLHRIRGMQQADAGHETLPPAPAEDLRMVGIGAQILADLGVGKMRVLGAARRIHNLSGFGLDVVEYIEER
jgi:3,4-dihydroxy 2-butanone 4-phosphate synthase/GTP cyclohydrolase II